LKQLDYASDEDEKNLKKKGNKFFADQMYEKEQREKKRTDKHILPVENFYDKIGKKLDHTFLPYVNIDIIFNHKNIWANLQNPNPARIYYHLHNPS